MTTLEDNEFDKYIQFLEKNREDFSTWIKILTVAENGRKINQIRKSFDLFLSIYPFAFGYWNKYSLLDLENQEEIYERAVKVAYYCVDIWIFYCRYSIENKPPDFTRNLFERAIEAVGTDFFSTNLWNDYIEWEFSQNKPENVTKIYQKVIQIPIQQIEIYWQNYKRHAQTRPLSELEPENLSQNENEEKKENEQNNLFKLQTILQKQEQEFQKTLVKFNKIIIYESGILRPYFHIHPLDDQQLYIWNSYLNYAEEQYKLNLESFEFVIKLYERSVISCSLYPSFWLKFALFYEENNKIQEARNIFQKATQIFIPNRPKIQNIKNKKNQKAIAEGFIKLAHFEYRISNKSNEIFINSLENTLSELTEYYANSRLTKRKNNKIYAIITIELCRFLTNQLMDNLMSSNQSQSDLINQIRELFERAFDYSEHFIHLWISYINFEIQIIQDDNISKVIDLFNRATSDESLLNIKDKLSICLLHVEFLRNFSKEISSLFLLNEKISKLKKEANEKKINYYHGIQKHELIFSEYFKGTFLKPQTRFPNTKFN
ncbi:pre-mRNA-processing factor 39 [Anaeramoeba ignava]|uniref:Pre-mRNA-processing factor 39 n=1 Tax=Anaeramoeba ignava TaxID=1746090 RepID=A0A9Q0L9T8_ANAIG|nr:pre-mRNA-processing factor 39 [Anaeramoeba ignava]